MASRTVFPDDPPDSESALHIFKGYLIIDSYDNDDGNKIANGKEITVSPGNRENNKEVRESDSTEELKKPNVSAEDTASAVNTSDDCNKVLEKSVDSDKRPDISDDCANELMKSDDNTDKDKKANDSTKELKKSNESSKELKKSNNNAKALEKSHSRVRPVNTDNAKKGSKPYNISQRLGTRRDPKKTIRDIERDKFNKTARDIVKKLESGLVPPGMEMDVPLKLDTGNLKPPEKWDSLNEPPFDIHRQELRERREQKRTTRNTEDSKRPYDAQIKRKKVWDRLGDPPRPPSRDMSPERNYMTPFFLSRQSPELVRYPVKPKVPDFGNRLSRLPIRSPRRYSRSPRRLSKSPRRGSRSPGRWSRSPKNFLTQRSRDNHQEPSRRLSRKRSTERFIEELIKTSGIMHDHGNPSSDINTMYSNPPLCTPYDMFPGFPLPLDIPQFPVNQPFMDTALPPNILPNLNSANSFPVPDSQLNPPPLFHFPFNPPMESQVFNPSPQPVPMPVKMNQFRTETSNKHPTALKITKNPSEVLKADDITHKAISLVDKKLKDEIINRCKNAVEKLETLHFPNRLFVPPSKHETFDDGFSTKTSPLRRQMPPSFNFTSKPNNTGAVMLPSIISTIGLDEALSLPEMYLPHSSMGTVMKSVSVQTDLFSCDSCFLRNVNPSKTKSTMTFRTRTTSVLTQVSNKDLSDSKMVFTPHQSVSSTQDLMHMTPAQILVAELTAKARNLQRSTVEAIHRARQDTSSSQTGNNSAQPTYPKKDSVLPKECKDSSRRKESRGRREEKDSSNRDDSRQGSRHISRVERNSERPRIRHDSRHSPVPKSSLQSGTSFPQGQSQLSKEYEEFLKKLNNEKHNAVNHGPFDSYGRTNRY